VLSGEAQNTALVDVPGVRVSPDMLGSDPVGFALIREETLRATVAARAAGDPEDLNFPDVDVEAHQ
jgi:hypothetical protein